MNGFSGQILFDKWCIGLYNVIFTFLPPLAFGLFDQTCSEKAREKVPKLYKNSQQSDLFNVKVKIFSIFSLPNFTLFSGIVRPIYENLNV